MLIIWQSCSVVSANKTEWVEWAVVNTRVITTLGYDLQPAFYVVCDLRNEPCFLFMLHRKMTRLKIWNLLPFVTLSEYTDPACATFVTRSECCFVSLTWKNINLSMSSGISQNTNCLEPVALMPQTSVIHLLVEWRWWIYTREELNLSVVLTWGTSRPEVSLQADGTDDSVSFPHVWRNISFLPGDAASGTARVGVIAVANYNITLEINWWEVAQEPEGVKFESSIVFKWWVGHHSVVFIAAATELTDVLK